MFTLTGGAVSGQPLHPSTEIFWPLKCRLSRWSMTFQLPPPAAVGLQPGLTTPPKLKSGWPLELTAVLAGRVAIAATWLLRTVPPPVNQHSPAGGVSPKQNGRLHVKLKRANWFVLSTLKVFPSLTPPPTRR